MEGDSSIMNMNQYRGTLVGIVDKSNFSTEFPKMLARAIKDVDLSKKLEEKFPQNCAISVQIADRVLEGNVIRYDGIGDAICILDHESKEERWVNARIQIDQL